MKTLVIRFSSIGDIVLAGAITAQLGEVVFLTLERFASLAAALPGVVEVRTWEACGRSATEGFDRIIDLHASPRSRLATAFRMAQVHRVRRHDIRRRLRPALKCSPAPSVIARYAQAAGVTACTDPWMIAPDLRDAPSKTLLLIPGAAHFTKRWPEAGYTAIGSRWPGPVLLLGSANETAQLEHLRDTIGAKATVLAEDGFHHTLAAIRSARAAVGGDTGLVHLAAAAGVHTVGLFGPTSADDGFWCHPGQALSADLPCSPCSRHGGAVCPAGNHACMVDIDEAAVWSALKVAL
jgi:ADP-heptose:LPS heptosyltransferase